MQIPVNSAWKTASWHPITRDGVMRVDANGGHEPHFYPNSHPHAATATTTAASLDAPGAIAPVPDPANSWQIEPQPAGAVMSRGPNSNTEGHPLADYLPARDFWLTGMSEDDRAATCANLAYAMAKISRKEVIVRWLLACYRTHESLALGQLVALAAECKRCGKEPRITEDELMHFVKATADKPLVDAVYKPIALPDIK
jgi:catalase